MTQIIPIQEFLQLAREFPVIDVRSPLEFTQGHIPGAHSVPLFSDEGRALVGTVYKQQGKQEAILAGLELVGPHMRNYVEQVCLIAPQKTVLVHCWRGGMRSGSIAWLLQTSGFTVYVLQGGYKSFKAHMRTQFVRTYNMRVISGPTGSGKTKMLTELACKYQVVDLEALAQHRGSALGALGRESQPTQEQFENNLGMVLAQMDVEHVLLIEDESQRIGSMFIPNELYQQMRNAIVIVLQVSREERINFLLQEYGAFDSAQIIACVERLTKRLGGALCAEICTTIIIGDLYKACDMLLDYYDQSYAWGLAQRDQQKIIYAQPDAPLCL